MSTPETRHEPEIAFVGEQDGKPERVLKGHLFNALRQFPSVQRAYLAQVRYAGSGQLEVALCLYGESKDNAIVEACAREFHAMFSPAQCLDILFVSPEQKSRLDSVCKPFFVK